MSHFIKHLLWTTLCPGTVTILVPLYLLAENDAFDQHLGWAQWIGMMLIVSGAGILFSCIYAFARFGKGTLSPIHPTRHLVIQGLYRYMRNPMYVGVVVILLGETIAFASWMMLIYAICMFILFNAFIMLFEEPYLQKHFGDEYDRYRHHVHRWLPGKPYL